MPSRGFLCKVVYRHAGHSRRGTICNNWAQSTGTSVRAYIYPHVCTGLYVSDTNVLYNDSND